MELTCPLCEARYGVPDGAIGRHGRDVSCTNCGHGWRAVPPVELDAAMAMAGSRHGRAEGAWPDDDADGTSAGAAEHRAARQSEPSRNAQLVEIREMIAQVQSDGGGSASREAPAEPAAPPLRAPAGEHGRLGGATPPLEATPRPELRRIDDFEESRTDASPHQDPLRRRMAELDARAARERSERERMRRSRFNRTDEGRGSGAFLTGFLLVLLVGAGLLAAYVMQPRLVERFPQSEPALTAYGERVDDLRTRVADGYARGRGWVAETLGDGG